MLSNAEVFVANAPLIALGWAYKWCGIDDWRGEKLVLHLDHITVSEVPLADPDVPQLPSPTVTVMLYVRRSRAWRNWQPR